MARDTHALSEPAFQTALEVLVADGVDVRVDSADGYTPTPALSHAILTWNREHPEALADGIVVTPSHNPPADGGFKYNPPSGGPADAGVTRGIEEDANALLRDGFERVRPGVARAGHGGCRRATTSWATTSTTSRTSSTWLPSPGRACASAWTRWVARPWPTGRPSPSGTGSTLSSPTTGVDPAFAFMTLDWDGSDPHGPIVAARHGPPHRACEATSTWRWATMPTPTASASSRHQAGLLSPNHVLAAAAWYLFGGARDWAARGGHRQDAGVLQRSRTASRPRWGAASTRCPWASSGSSTACSMARWPSAARRAPGMSFLRRDGRPWSTDKDGIIACLLAAEMTARMGHDPGVSYARAHERFGAPLYRRIDARATPAQKAALGRLSAADVHCHRAGRGPCRWPDSPRRPATGQPIGGLKVVTERGWFAARPSGTEDVTKLYAESFVDEAHLARIIEEAQLIVAAATKA